jgi:hypothetical protein
LRARPPKLRRRRVVSSHWPTNQNSAR